MYMCTSIGFDLYGVSHGMYMYCIIIIIIIDVQYMYCIIYNHV